MSEHLADLNEKLTAQSEVIEQFRFEAKVSSVLVFYHLWFLVVVYICLCS